MKSSRPLAITEILARVSRAWAWFTASAAFEALVEEASSTLDADEMGRLHWEDVALLDAFRRGSPQAAAIMHQTVGARLVELLIQKGAEPMDADDLVQDRLCSLLDAAPTSYAGRGSLVGWLRTCVMRDLGELREMRERRARSPMLAESSVILHDVESAMSAHHHRPHLRLVLREIFETLDPQARRILRLVYAGGLTAQQVGALLGLHRVTVQKKLGELRSDIDKRTRRELERRFGLDESTISGLLDPERLRFETSLSAILSSSAPR